MLLTSIFGLVVGIINHLCALDILIIGAGSGTIKVSVDCYIGAIFAQMFKCASLYQICDNFNPIW